MTELARATGLETLLFWLMALTGGAVLAPCLLLPPWLEHEAQRERYAAALANREAARLAAERAERDMQFLKDDPAYVLRLAEQEFGLGPANMITVPVGPTPPEHPDVPVPGLATRPSDAPAAPLLPELTEFVARVQARYPYTDYFVRNPSRTVFMIVGGGLLVTAIVLLGNAGRRDEPAP